MKEQEVSWLNLHAEHSRTYITFISVILAASISVFPIITNNFLLQETLIIVLFLNSLFCIFGLLICNRFYHRFLETVAIIAKIESMFVIGKERVKVTDQIFPEDKYYIPIRWVEDRSKYKTSKEFVAKSINRGANIAVKIGFIILFVINLLLMLRFST
jgi:hypothetical protein